MITAVLPAHNEQESLPAAIASVRGQVDRVLVVSDNSTDDTVAVARAHGADVLETVGNTERKAGALNQALATISGGFVLVMDADTTVSAEFVSVALERLQDYGVGAVGAVFEGESPSTMLELFQALEWQRFRRELSRSGKVWVLSGTAAVLRMSALRNVRDARDAGELPGRGFYLADAATEDFELTVSLKRLGYRLRSPLACSSATEMMPTWRDLWNQRLRWYGGALETIQRHGVTWETTAYIRQQAMLGLGSMAFLLLLVTSTAWAVLGGPGLSPIGLALGAVFALERVVTVRGARRRLFAALVLPELVYSLFLMACWVASVARFAAGRRIVWTHTNERNEQ